MSIAALMPPQKACLVMVDVVDSSHLHRLRVRHAIASAKVTELLAISERDSQPALAGVLTVLDEAARYLDPQNVDDAPQVARHVEVLLGRAASRLVLMSDTASR